MKIRLMRVGHDNKCALTFEIIILQILNLFIKINYN
jgi:hypothetical protein